jgi:hypothetical protein
MFTPQRRRRFGYEIEQEKPHLLWRMMIIGLIGGIAWWSSIQIGKIFETASGNRTAMTLFLEEGQTGVQVALQGEEWQKGETHLKLYEGDAIRTGSVANATLVCFDGTILYLDTNTEISLTESTKRENGVSTLAMTIRRGRLWTSTGIDGSGGVLRTLHIPDAELAMKHNTEAMIGVGSIAVMKEPSDGIMVTLKKKPYTTFSIGEGQGWNIDENAREKLALGESPYRFRDPLTLAIIQDPFVTTGIQSAEKYRLQATKEESSEGQTASSLSSEEGMVTTINIVSPRDGDIITTPVVSVRGTVSARVNQININNTLVNINSDRTFSAEVKIDAKEKSPTIHIEAMNAEGIILAKEDRTLVNNSTPPSFPAVKISAPIGSGQTLTTSDPIIEIAGETAENTQAILVNDYALQLFKKGKRTWSYLANNTLGNLKVGKNAFTIVAVGPDGIKSPARTIFIEFVQRTGTGTTTPPALKQNAPLAAGTLSVSSPSSGTEGTTNTAELSILGKTSKETTSISVNGYTLSLYEKGSEQWKYIASVERGTMKRGRNVYRIVARNSSGEILDVLEYILTFEP